MSSALEESYACVFKKWHYMDIEKGLLDQDWFTSKFISSVFNPSVTCCGLILSHVSCPQEDFWNLKQFLLWWFNLVAYVVFFIIIQKTCLCCSRSSSSFIYFTLLLPTTSTCFTSYSSVAFMHSVFNVIIQLFLVIIGCALFSLRCWVFLPFVSSVRDFLFFL